MESFRRFKGMKFTVEGRSSQSYILRQGRKIKLLRVTREIDVKQERNGQKALWPS